VVVLVERPLNGRLGSRLSVDLANPYKIRARGG
jgi:hypothetical protein